MAFVYPDNDYCCKVTFHMRKDFRDDISKERELRTHYVDKGDLRRIPYGSLDAPPIKLVILLEGILSN